MSEPVAETPAGRPAPVAAPGPAAWLPDGVTVDAASDDAAPAPAADDVAPAPTPDDVAPAPTPDEPPPVSPDSARPDDPQAIRWLPDAVSAGAAASAAASVNAPVATEQSRWLPEPAVAGGGLRELNVPIATLDPEHLARSVRAYCNELLDRRITPEATETILSRFHAVSDDSHATAEELLRLARKTTADYALAPNAWRGDAAARREECRATPGRIAARDANTLTPAARADLESHLERCLSCQAIELRCKRAARAFTTMLAITALDEDAAGEDAAAAGLAAPAEPRTRRRTAGVRRGFALASAAALLAACAAIALVLTLGNAHRQVTTAVPASAASTPAAPSSAKVHHRTTSVKRRVVRHHGRTHKPAKHSKPRSGGGGASTAVASAPGGSSAAPAAPASTAAPAAAAPAPAPAASSGSSGAGGSSGSAGGSGTSAGPVSVTQQGSGLPAQSAPTQGIGSGGSAGSQH